MRERGGAGILNDHVHLILANQITGYPMHSYVVLYLPPTCMYTVDHLWSKFMFYQLYTKLFIENAYQMTDVLVQLSICIILS